VRLVKRPVIALLALLFVVVAPALAAAGDFAEGLLWKIEKPGKAPSWVFGTFHSADPQVLALPKEVTDVVAAVESVSVEVVMTGAVPFRMQQSMRAEKGQGLDITLPPELLDIVLGLAPEYGMKPEQVLKLKPWALTLLMGAPPSDQPAPGRAFLDMWLMQQANSKGKHLYGLETAEEQVEVFDGMPLPAQVTLLSWTLATASESTFGTMRALYLARDLAGLEALFEETLASLDPDVAALFRARLIDNRNKLMVKRMAKRLAEGNALIAVGALHLPGELGVLRLLEKKGYTVTRVY
jgi:hypothetical protein